MSSQKHCTWSSNVAAACGFYGDVAYTKWFERMPTVIEDLDIERKLLDLLHEKNFENFIMCYSQVYK